MGERMKRFLGVLAAITMCCIIITAVLAAVPLAKHAWDEAGGLLSAGGDDVPDDDVDWSETGKDITASFTDKKFLEAVYAQVGEYGEKLWDVQVQYVTELYVDESGIRSLAGLEHFTSLETLSCSGNLLTELPKLPKNLKVLDCSNNRLAALPELPAGLESLACAANRLAQLEKLPSGLVDLDCSGNRLTALDVTGLDLVTLHCYDNDMGNPADVKGFTQEWDDYLYYIYFPQQGDYDAYYGYRGRS